jgi:hypothetical protein
MKKRNIKETSSYVGAAEDEGLYDQMNDLLALATALVGEEFNSPEEALETLEDGNWEEPEVVDELISQIYDLIDEIDAVEAEAYYGELDDEEGMDFGESFKSKKKIIKLTENDLTKIVRKVIKEQGMISELGGMDDSHPKFGNMNLKNHSSDELDDILHNRLSDDDEYYGTFDDEHKIDRFDKYVTSDYEDFDEEEFEDFDAYSNSRYGSDKRNRWAFNDKKYGKGYFDRYQEKSGGKPFKIRKKRR